MLVTRNTARVARASGRRTSGGALARARPLAYPQGGSIRKDTRLAPLGSRVGGRASDQEVVGQARGQRHDGQLRVDAQGGRDGAAVADVQLGDAVHPAVAVQDAVGGAGAMRAVPSGWK